jgi:lipopolysaccharide/colanic/teichoic acid biosynthesis glycosyltransferase
MYEIYGKRIFDIIFSFILLLIFLPLLLLCSVGILISSKGPILFIQKRVGKNRDIFNIYKLRTMIVNNNRTLNQTTNNDPDVFLFGKILRRTKLDELPQLLNIFLGSMSFVGPRPILPSSFTEIENKYISRLDQKPGLTGLAQVNGNIYLTQTEKFDLDLNYCKRVTFLTDMAIILKTIAVVVLGEEKFKRKK